MERNQLELLIPGEREPKLVNFRRSSGGTRQTWSGKVLLKEGCHREIQGNVPGDVWSYPDMSNTYILMDIHLLEPGDNDQKQQPFEWTLSTPIDRPLFQI
jgi:hypothetical protein